MHYTIAETLPLSPPLISYHSFAFAIIGANSAFASVLGKLFYCAEPDLCAAGKHLERVEESSQFQDRQYLIYRFEGQEYL